MSDTNSGLPEGCPEIGTWCEEDMEIHYGVRICTCKFCTPVEILPVGSRERLRELEAALEPFRSGGLLSGSVIAWIANGAEACGKTKQDGLAAAKAIVTAKCAVDDTLRALSKEKK